jgi:hypothetical protein
MADHALAEQLEGLMNLLKAVGIDSVDNREVRRASLALKNQGSGAPIVFPADDPEAKQLNDDQIESMILKLQQAQAQAPQLMEALEEYIDQRHAATSRGTHKKGVKKKKVKTTKAQVKQTKQQHRNQHQQFQQQQQLRQQQQQHYEDEEVEEDEEYVEEVIEEPEAAPKKDHDDHDEEEEEDDFDEDADYPMVGPGVSDDCSVISDMSTPTVVSSIHVNDEEQYQDMLPSMYLSQGGGPPMMIQPPKRRNLVSQVGAPNNNAGSGPAGVPMRVGPAAPPAGMGLSGSHHGAVGGAAAKRRQAYQQTMSRLHQNPYGTVTAGPAVNPNAIPAVEEEIDRQLPPRSRSGDGGLTVRPSAPGRTRAGSADGRPLTSNSYHSGDVSFDVSPDGWNPFGDINAPQESLIQDESESGLSNTSGKVAKKKTSKTTKVSATKAKTNSVAEPTKSPKTTKKKKAAGSTTIDRDGFLVGGPSAPLSPQKKATTKKDSDNLSKSQHTAGSKKGVKKKVVKKPDSGEGQPKKSPTNKAPREPR